MRAVWSRVRPAVDLELAVRRRDAELVEEDPRQLVVVMLPRVDEQLLVALAQGQRHGGRLDELRAVSDDGDDSHDVGRAMGGERHNHADGSRAKASRGRGGRCCRAARHAVWYLRYQLDGDTRDDDAPVGSASRPRTSDRVLVVRRDPQAIERHREHLVVPNEHGHSIRSVSLRCEHSSSQRSSERSRCSCRWSTARNTAAWRATSPQPRAPPRHGRSPPSTARPGGPGVRAVPSRTPTCTGGPTRRITNSLSRRGSTPNGISRAANRATAGRAAGGGRAWPRSRGRPPRRRPAAGRWLCSRSRSRGDRRENAWLRRVRSCCRTLMPRSTTSLEGRRVLITGAARGIGAALAERLHERGARVAVVGLEDELLAEVAARCGGAHWSAATSPTARRSSVPLRPRPTRSAASTSWWRTQASPRSSHSWAAIPR